MRRNALLLLVLIAGCTAWNEKSRAIKLQDLMNGYTQTMEWSDYARALRYRKFTPDHPPPDLTPYTNIKISDYRPSQTSPGEDEKTVYRIVQVRYIVLSRMSERSMTTQEIWKYSDEDGRWYIVSDLPAFPR